MAPNSIYATHSTGMPMSEESLMKFIGHFDPALLSVLQAMLQYGVTPVGEAQKRWNIVQSEYACAMVRWCVGLCSFCASKEISAQSSDAGEPASINGLPAKLLKSHVQTLNPCQKSGALRLMSWSSECS
eukprot:525873-Amphidinium_carterae.8